MKTGIRFRLLVSALALVALGVILAYFGARAPEPPGMAVPDSGPSSSSAEAGEPRQAQPESPEQPAEEQKPGIDAAWLIVDPGTVDELPPYKEVVPGRALVKVSEALRLGMAGDRIALEVPQIGRTFDGIVERRDVDAFGNVSYIGLVTESDGRDYRFVITAGARDTFAHVGTSRGTFELVAYGELGWLMPTAGMDQHMDYSRPDYVIPGDPRRRPVDALRNGG